MVYTRLALSLTTQQDREGKSLVFAFPETTECKDVGHPRGSWLALSRAEIRLLGLSGRVLA